MKSSVLAQYRASYFSLASYLSIASYLGLACYLVSAAGILFANSVYAANQSESITVIPFTVAQMKQANIKAYQLKAPTESDNKGSVALTGTVSFNSQGQVGVSTPVAGLVQSLNVNNMQTVKKGQLLTTLFSPEVSQLQAEYLKNTAQLKLAEQQLQRELKLHNEGIIAYKRVADQRNQVELLKIGQQQQAKYLQFMGASKQGMTSTINVYAPISGVVNKIDAVIGNNVAAGTNLMTLQNNQDLELALQASEAQAKDIKVGATVNIDQCDNTATIKRFSNQVNSQTQTQTVYSTVPKNCLEPNQFVTAKVAVPVSSSSNPTGWQVPNSSIVQQHNLPYVFVVKANGFLPVQVQVSPKDNQYRIIYSSQLKTGQYIASSNTSQIKGVWNGIGAEQAPRNKAAVTSE